jgi:hypothetical protein
MSIARMRSTLSQREFMRWRKYWEFEPWGPWRDNMHAALIARSVLQPHVKKGSKISLDDFMLMLPDLRRQKDQKEASARLVDMLRTIARTERAKGAGGKSQRRKRIKAKG